MRFKYYFPSQIIEDRKTGKRYYGNKAVADLLNEINDENEVLKEDVKKVLNDLQMELKNG